MNILIADDDPTNLKLLSAMLAKEGHQVVPAGDGAEALTLLDRGDIEAIISDIFMPRMDGFRLCLEVRKREQFNKVPFIFYSATYTSAGDEKAAMDLGADKFVRKPAPAAKLMHALQAAIKQGPRRRLRPGPAPQELDLMKEYSERLVAKLEKKNLELQAHTESLRQSEVEVRKSRERLRALAGRIQAAREEERIRIARELHDGLGEFLTGIEMGLAWVQASLERKDRIVPRKQLIEKIASLGSMARGSAERVRKLCTELRPSVLDDLGLEAAIEWQAREFQARTYVRCHTKVDLAGAQPNAEQATAMFRIFQEILTNAARHSQASKIRVVLKKVGQNLVLQVKDNGIGIRPEQLDCAKSLGLLGMQERTDFLGGKVEIVGRLGKGTTVTVTVPMDARPTRHARD